MRSRWTIAVVLVLAKCADDGEALKKMPWRVIIMVTGVTVLIAILEKAEGIDLMVSLVARISTPNTVSNCFTNAPQATRAVVSRAEARSRMFRKSRT